MPETLNTRVTRLEKAMADLAEKMNILTDSQIKTDEQFRKTDERIRELNETTDKRIADLVSAIGEFIRRNNNGGQH